MSKRLLLFACVFAPASLLASSTATAQITLGANDTHSVKCVCPGEPQGRLVNSTLADGKRRILDCRCPGTDPGPGPGPGPGPDPDPVDCPAEPTKPIQRIREMPNQQEKIEVPSRQQIVLRFNTNRFANKGQVSVAPAFAGSDRQSYNTTVVISRCAGDLDFQSAPATCRGAGNVSNFDIIAGRGGPNDCKVPPGQTWFINMIAADPVKLRPKCTGGAISCGVVFFSNR